MLMEPVSGRYEGRLPNQALQGASQQFRERRLHVEGVGCV